MEHPAKTACPDFKTEGRQVSIDLLRALALSGRRSVEIQLLLDSQADEKAGCQALALLLTDISLDDVSARTTFARLREHQQRLKQAVGRAVGIKSAAMDYLENIELALGIKEDEETLNYRQLALMALRDHLTGLANFRAFMRRLNDETKRADRYRHLLSLIMLDIDHFKEFNDTYGHLNGNKALQHLSALLKSQVRETDMVARYGGEEFVIVLPETPKHEARQLAERVRVRVQNSPVELPRIGQCRLTISLGVATYPRDARSAEQLLAAADDALYASKNGGRDRVSNYDPATFAVFTFAPPDTRVQRVSVIGDFNGWDKNLDRLQLDGKGAFSLKVQLTPGRYVYKFVIDGEKYIADPRNPESVSDGYGGRNSVLHVK